MAKWLRAEREARGLEQVDVAKRLRRSQTWVSRVEAGRRPLHVVEFLAIARVIGFSPAALIRRLAKIGENNAK